VIEIVKEGMFDHFGGVFGLDDGGLYGGCTDYRVNSGSTRACGSGECGWGGGGRVLGCCYICIVQT
jgi:hypothetical protein